MKAFLFAKYGPPDVLELREVKTPIPKDNEVLIRVHATSVNDWDWCLVRGKPFFIRLMGGLSRPKITILGVDVAGRVETVGRNVKKYQVGDDVYGDLSECGFGGFAEYVCANENALALKPASMTFTEAAAIPHAAMLAVQGLSEIGQIQPRQKILINGAGGGVGFFAVQIAKLIGVDVTGVDSASKLDMMRSMGFDQVIDYAQEDFTKNGQRYDLVLDTKTNRSTFDYVRALSPDGTYVTVGGSMIRLLQALFLGPWISKIRKKNIRIVALEPNKDLDYINELFEAGKIKPVIDGPYEFSEVPEAIRRFGEGKHKGKVVIAVEKSN